jgi:hypothetical protein
MVSSKGKQNMLRNFIGRIKLRFYDIEDLQAALNFLCNAKRHLKEDPELLSEAEHAIRMIQLEVLRRGINLD